MKGKSRMGRRDAKESILKFCFVLRNEGDGGEGVGTEDEEKYKSC